MIFASKKNRNKQNTTFSAKTQKNNDEDAICLYCDVINNTFQKSSEYCVGCQFYGRLAHKACASVKDEDVEEIHICVFRENN